MTIECPKCRTKELKTGERTFVSRTVLNSNRMVNGEFMVTNNKEIYVRLCSCPCGFDGYTIEVDIINLMSFQKAIT